MKRIIHTGRMLFSLGLIFCTIFAGGGIYPGRLTVSACEFLSVEGPCRFSFPADHGSHPGFRTEWWYYTGNLESDDRKTYGFQLTFFRIQTRPTCKSDDWPERPSAWRTNQIYFAHAALTDVAARRHHQAQAAARNALGMSGVSQERDRTTIFLKKWQAVIEPGQQLLAAQAPDFGFELQLSPLKPPVAHGRDGYSRKGSSPNRASCYYSFTRLATEGRIRIGDKAIPVRGLSWMDHEYSTALLEPGIVGWDWFSLQLSDQTEVMMFLLRKADGTRHPASSGTMVLSSGDTLPLGHDQFSIQVQDQWLSPATGTRYPVRWNIRIPDFDLELDVRSAVADQEMQTQATTGVVYWEGSVTAEGTKHDRPISAKGYVEMTGYGKKFDAPM
ncbi:MAG: carotenoid 1,2-hydratase [Deltaproteobacteria bacterium]|nr:carotenoid 1,2-hydratase [Deltaproteobacteria bacterium]